MLRRSWGRATTSASWVISTGIGKAKVVSGVVVPKGVLIPSLDARAMSAMATAVGPATRSHERMVRIQRVREGASSQ